MHALDPEALSGDDLHLVDVEVAILGPMLTFCWRYVNT
jgi:hypothetical protein